MVLVSGPNQTQDDKNYLWLSQWPCQHSSGFCDKSEDLQVLSLTIVCWVTRISKYLTQTDHLCPLALWQSDTTDSQKSRYQLTCFISVKISTSLLGLAFVLISKYRFLVANCFNIIVENDLMAIIDNLKCSKYTAKNWCYNFNINYPKCLAVFVTTCQ